MGSILVEGNEKPVIIESKDFGRNHPNTIMKVIYSLISFKESMSHL